METKLSPQDIEELAHTGRTRFTHLPEDELRAYEEKTLETTTRQRVEVHLGMCRICQGRLALLREEELADQLWQLTRTFKETMRSLGRALNDGLALNRAVAPLQAASADADDDPGIRVKSGDWEMTVKSDSGTHYKVSCTNVALRGQRICLRTDQWQSPPLILQEVLEGVLLYTEYTLSAEEASSIPDLDHLRMEVLPNLDEDSHESE